MERDGDKFDPFQYCIEGCEMCHTRIQRMEELLAKNKQTLDQQVCLNPIKLSTDECVVCKEANTRVTLMTSESRGVMARQLQVLAEDIRRMELRLAEDKPLFVHQDCLKPSTLSLRSALHGLAAIR